MFLNPSEKIRLLRLTPGSNPDDILEELFSMAGDTRRAEFPNGLDLTPDDPLQPPIVADWPEDVEPTIMHFTRGGFSFDLKLDGRGNLTFNDAPFAGPDSPSGGGDGGGTSSTTNVFPARVDAYLGANLYTVTIYPRGTTQAGTQVTALQLEGNPAFPQKANGTRWTYVVKAGSQYTMNMPTWGNPTP